jgi:hypothetical protein
MRAIRAVIPRRPHVAADAWVVGALVPVQLERLASRVAAAAAADGRHAVEGRFDEEAVVPVGAGACELVDRWSG